MNAIRRRASLALIAAACSLLLQLLGRGALDRHGRMQRTEAVRQPGDRFCQQQPGLRQVGLHLLEMRDAFDAGIAEQAAQFSHSGLLFLHCLSMVGCQLIFQCLTAVASCLATTAAAAAAACCATVAALGGMAGTAAGTGTGARAGALGVAGVEIGASSPCCSAGSACFSSLMVTAPPSRAALSSARIER